MPTHLFKIILAEGRKGEGAPSTRLPAMGVFVIPNKKLGSVDLIEFQVSLEKLEAYTGTTFHSKLDRSKVCTGHVGTHANMKILICVRLLKTI